MGKRDKNLTTPSGLKNIQPTELHQFNVRKVTQYLVTNKYTKIDALDMCVHLHTHTHRSACAHADRGTHTSSESPAAALGLSSRCPESGLWIRPMTPTRKVPVKHSPHGWQSNFGENMRHRFHYTSLSTMSC